MTAPLEPEQDADCRRVRPRRAGRGDVRDGWRGRAVSGPAGVVRRGPSAGHVTGQHRTVGEPERQPKSSCAHAVDGGCRAVAAAPAGPTTTGGAHETTVAAV